jgi:hypothetical protein
MAVVMASRHCWVGVPCSSTVAFSAPALTPTLALAQLFLTVQNDMLGFWGSPENTRSYRVTDAKTFEVTTAAAYPTLNETVGGDCSS